MNRPATVSGLIAFCSNFSSTASSAAVGAIIGANGAGADLLPAWIHIYYVMGVCAVITALSSLVSLRLSRLGAGASHVDDDINDVDAVRVALPPPNETSSESQPLNHRS